jgi:hypothetical protein
MIKKHHLKEKGKKNHGKSNKHLKPGLIFKTRNP